MTEVLEEEIGGMKNQGWTTCDTEGKFNTCVLERISWRMFDPTLIVKLMIIITETTSKKLKNRTNCLWIKSLLIYYKYIDGYFEYDRSSSDLVKMLKLTRKRTDEK